LRYSFTILDPGTRCRWSASRPGRFTPGESAAVTHWIVGQLGNRTGQDAVENRKMVCPAGNRTPVVQRVVRRYTD
jgi:hypothetical protein